MTVVDKSLSAAQQESVWFAMSATFGRALKAKAFLEGKGVKCFVPMRYEMVDNKGQGKERKLIPAITNLIFVYTTKDTIQQLKSGVNYLHYLTHSVGGVNQPIVVPEHQMQHFIAVCDTHNDKLVYLSPGEVNLEAGTAVKIIGSAFDGVEGTFVKVKGSRKKSVVVLVQGIAAVMIAEFADGYLQVLER